MDIFDSVAAPILDAFPGITADELSFAPPPRQADADVALRTFAAAKKLSTPPPKLAADIAANVKFGPEVLEVKTAGPYLNFRIDRNQIGRMIARKVLDAGAAYGSKGLGKGQRVLVEHTSINPNASPHVGRARNAMIGDSIVRLLRFEGYDVEVHYYVNDMGRQIALLSLVCEEPLKMTFEEMLQLYVEANQRAESDTEFAGRGYELLAKMEEGHQQTRDKFFAITELCLHGQLMVLARLGVNYDAFVRESQYVKDPRLEKLLDALREREALFVDEEERLVVDLRQLGHPHDEGRYFVLMRANGSSLYGYRDLAYTIDKADRQPNHNIIILGEDHKLYLQQLALILGTVGYSVPEPVYYAYILLKEGKMSTRQGKVVLLSDFLDEATERAREKVRQQCTDMDEFDQDKIASKVAVAAIRFAILRVNPTKNVTFDWESSLSFTGDTGPYVQYSCARIASILRKHGEMPEAPPETFPVETTAEWELLLKLAAFPETVESAVSQRNAAPVAQFALDTARLFTQFYHDCPVLNAPEESQRLARICICRTTYQALKNALHLLGIEALDRM